MKILYVGPYRQADGWGNQARSYIRSLDTVSDVVIRPVYLGGQVANLEEFENNNEDLIKLENKSDKDCDIVIQNGLPSFFSYDASFKKNIGLMLTETGHLDYTSWPSYMNLMDEIWVPSKQCVININPQLDSDGAGNRVRVPVNNIPSPIDTSVFEQNYENLDGLHSDLFNFYYIGELVDRKNLEDLLVAFHSEFDPVEPVGLVIKTSNGARSKVLELTNAVKKRLKIFSRNEFYKSEAIIDQWLDDEKMLSLHHTCDCFAFPSHGEACCRPALTAMGFGNTPIVTSNTGMTDFIDRSTGWEIESHDDVCYCDDRQVRGLYTSRESWRGIKIKSLMENMREAYENTELRKQKAIEGKKRVFQHSYENVGKKMRELLA